MKRFVECFSLHRDDDKSNEKYAKYPRIKAKIQGTNGRHQTTHTHKNDFIFVRKMIRSSKKFIESHDKLHTHTHTLQKLNFSVRFMSLHWDNTKTRLMAHTNVSVLRAQLRFWRCLNEWEKSTFFWLHRQTISVEMGSGCDDKELPHHFGWWKSIMKKSNHNPSKLKYSFY